VFCMEKNFFSCKCKWVYVIYAYGCMQIVEVPKKVVDESVGAKKMLSLGALDMNKN
jgi:hypothetical protein